ncbi:hypothetical protein Fmac_010836 [Flemingia macrophylla]|uniref:K+ potassium transporter integral membrane domain-containing protein n=1 Tax=Flemingia macrophylla TaxID=520843 RepID=A0ABD1MKP5_9FABA
MARLSNLEAIVVSITSTHFSKLVEWTTILILAFQSIGIVYGDIDTSPLYVFSSIFTDGIRHKVFNLNLKESTLSATSPSTNLSCLSLPSSIKKPISEATDLSLSALLSLSLPISLSLHLVGDFPPDTPSHLSAFMGCPHHPVPPDHSL